MKLSRFLLAVTFVTFFCLVYVYQQTEVVRMAYVGNRKTALLQVLLDKNSILRYNLGKSISLARIGEAFSESDDFQIPDAYQLVKLSSPAEGTVKAGNHKLRQESLLSRIFGIKREAQAKTLKP